MKDLGTLLLTRKEISALLRFSDYFEAVEAAFRAHAENHSMSHGLLHLDSRGGEFHVKGGGLQLAKMYFAFKINGGFYQNTRLRGLPNIIGTIALCDGESGYPLAIMDSGEITRQRTAAAAAVAAKRLARSDAETITICGCGTQGQAQLSAMKWLFPLRKAYAFDVDAGQRERFAAKLSQELEIPVEPVDEPGPAVRESDVAVTCTPSRQPYLKPADVRPGTFIAAMGADSPEKQELDTSVLASSKLVVDILAQCEQVGELHHALEAGAMRREQVHAELGEIVAGRKPGRTSRDEITIFDSTGTALQDVAAAAAVYEKALAANVGKRFNFLG
jgi:ornithine cyclodeaminase/alanine dehydrogenase